MAATFDVEISSTGTRKSVLEQMNLGEQAMADLHVPAPALFVGRKFGMDSDGTKDSGASYKKVILNSCFIFTLQSSIF